MDPTARAKTVALDRVDGFVAIDGKGRVTIYSGKVDLGTGRHRADPDGRRGARRADDPRDRDPATRC